MGEHYTYAGVVVLGLIGQFYTQVNQNATNDTEQLKGNLGE